MAADSPESPDSTTGEHGGSRGEKRKAGDNAKSLASNHTRSKRNRYISIACNECKRRKIKCNGQTPCQRCGHLNLECVYAPNCCTNSLKDSEYEFSRSTRQAAVLTEQIREFQLMRDHISTLQDQVNALWDNVNELRNRPEQYSQPESLYPDPHGRSISISRTLPPLVPSRRPPQKVLPQFHGPTSSAYGFDVARTSLQTMGITPNPADDGGVSRERSRPVSPVPLVQQPHSNKDPVWSIDQNEALRLCKVYEEEIHIMYPILDMEKLYDHLKMLYTFLSAARRAGFGQPGRPGEDAMDDDQTTVLKMVLACALVLEGQGHSEMGQKLFDSAKMATDLTLISSLSLKAITLVVLTATFYFQKDEEAQAWRFIGIAGRFCIEMGLHRKDSILRTFTNEAEYREALRMFWVVYALDRRWSFGTGMPFVLQDVDIDPDLPEPDDTFLYVKYITKHNKIATRIWQHNAAFETGNASKPDEVGFLDYQIIQWYQQLPESLQFYNSDVAHENTIPDRGLRRLRFLMYLRKNQARISIYRPIMHSATSIMQSRGHAETIVTIAKDTINIITQVNRTSDIYRTQQVCYNYFLVQALAAIFLAVAHAPALFCHDTREEFYAAIDLIKGFSTKSHTSKRLWRTIRGLKEMGDKLGMLDRGGMVNGEQEQDAHSNAAVAMAGLAGHRADNFSFNGRHGHIDELTGTPQDGQQMGNELTALFELAGAYGSNYGNSDQNGFGGLNKMQAEGHPDGDSFNGFLSNEPELTRIMNDLF